MNNKTKWTTHYLIERVAVGSENNMKFFDDGRGLYSMGNARWTDDRRQAKRYATRQEATRAEGRCRVPTSVIEVVTAHRSE
jgi:hypothetical protein